LVVPVHASNYGVMLYHYRHPVAYYGLRMLDQITKAGDLPTTGNIQMTAVVAKCADVTRPKQLPSLELETVNLTIDPKILEKNARLLYEATDLFRRWIKAITGGIEVDLVIHELEECATVTFELAEDKNILSYPKVDEMLGMVPTEVNEATRLWWVVAPSGVPGDGSGYTGGDFITGGQNFGEKTVPLIVSDDAWFIRKPAHLGNGLYSDIERRAYIPQWFQHEFMHYLFGAWPEFGLEETGHQWFNRTTWPLSFKGSNEADYYYEAVEKLLKAPTTTPTLAQKFKEPHGPLAKVSEVGIATLVGDYQRNPIQNNWHEIGVTKDSSGGLTITNKAGRRWDLQTLGDKLFTSEGKAVYIELDGSKENLVALIFNKERYAPTSPKKVIGPTPSPTRSPTDAPTVSPTEAPTVSPTEAPTVSPTEAPTVSPTDAPTASPTEAPTISPTDAPTVSPTAAPVPVPKLKTCIAKSVKCGTRTQRRENISCCNRLACINRRCQLCRRQRKSCRKSSECCGRLKCKRGKCKK